MMRMGLCGGLRFLCRFFFLPLVLINIAFLWIFYFFGGDVFLVTKTEFSNFPFIYIVMHSIMHAKRICLPERENCQCTKPMLDGRTYERSAWSKWSHWVFSTYRQCCALFVQIWLDMSNGIITSWTTFGKSNKIIANYSMPPGGTNNLGYISAL